MVNLAESGWLTATQVWTPKEKTRGTKLVKSQAWATSSQNKNHCYVPFGKTISTIGKNMFL